MNLNLDYCCVRGCSNNTSLIKKNSKGLKFHTFPKNRESRLKWLQAIGCPTWEPPDNVLICSAHISDDMIQHDRPRSQINKEVFPVKKLPPKSDLVASSLEVCRICLATDVKMFSLHESILHDCIESILGLSDKHNLEGLPQFVCYECGALLIKSYKLIKKSMIAQKTLLDIITENGCITKCLVKKKDREQLSIHSTMGSPSFFPIIEFKHKEESSTPNPKTFTADCVSKIIKPYKRKLNISENNRYNLVVVEKNTESQLDLVEKCEDNDPLIDFAVEDSLDIRNSSVSESNEVYESQNSDSDYFEDEENQSDNENNLKVATKNKEWKKTNGRVRNRAKKRKELEKDFDVVGLTLQEQINEFNKEVQETPSLSTKAYFECDVCQKKFERKQTLIMHIAYHDPVRGDVECPVCKYRYKKYCYLRKHINLEHRRYHCKLCPKVFMGWHLASKHRRRHLSHPCPQCEYGTTSASFLTHHRLREHGDAVHCVHCGLGFVCKIALRTHKNVQHAGEKAQKPDSNFRCEECKVSFHSEEAKAVHMLMAKVHRNKNQTLHLLDIKLRAVCRLCGKSFSTVEERVKHGHSEHGLIDYDAKRSDPVSYPKQCEHCDLVLNTRRKHYLHVKRDHPSKINSWKPVVTAVCTTCGMGCQRPSSLRLHELRHHSPTLKCPRCARLFHDKYTLARHQRLHAPQRPRHACGVCGASFNHQSNLARHRWTHNNELRFKCPKCHKAFKGPANLYQHMRVVHPNAPPPPRPKRTMKT